MLLLLLLPDVLPAEPFLWLQRYPEAKVVGHRDLSPDTNYNGIVDPWERIKECPCFEVIGEFSIN